MKKLQECYVLLMLVVSLSMITSCSKDDDASNGVRFNYTFIRE